MDKERLIIFDTTMRDGEQSPGASMTRDEKLQIARALERMRVDVIEAGFPVASPGDFEAVKSVAETVSESIVCGLARAMEKDIRIAADAVRPARRRRIHTFIATSPIHMRVKLNMTPDDVVKQAVYAVRLARQFTDDVEFSPEDAGRSDFDFLCRILEAVIDAGARTINIPDTVGYTMPHQFGDLIRQLRERIPNADKAVISVHCHNDLGLATANSLSAVLNGARQVECTINALGERAGNASLEEVVMTVRTRHDVFPCQTGLDTTQIMHCSRLVSRITGFPVQPNKAIVGANAFAHEAGIHQDGVLKHRETYEIMRPEDVGLSENRLVLGKHSGRRALRARLSDLGIEPSGEEELNTIFERFKRLADAKHEIFDEDLQVLVSDVIGTADQTEIRLIRLRVHAETGEKPTADITLNVRGKECESRAEGDGLVDAAFQAIESILNSGCRLDLYSVKSITGGSDAQGEVTVRLIEPDDSRLVGGHGADTDIVVASARAYINAINKIMSDGKRLHPQRIAAAAAV